jgi:hypothetical protein
MTRLNLNETCLLEASGELDAGARQRLLEYFEKHPSARRHYEQIKGELERLRSLPKVELTEAQKARHLAGIKGGIHAKLDRDHHEEVAARRRKFIYRALASISAAAAAIVIVAGVLSLDKSIEETHRQQKIAKINEAVERLLPYGEQPNQVDDTLQNVANSIQELQSENPSVAGIHDTELSNLLDELSNVPQTKPEPPAPSPDSL